MVLHHRKSRPEPILPARASPTTGTQLPEVSVIIPTRNRAELVRKCLEGLNRTDYPNPEIIVVDNDSDEPEALAYFDQLRNEGIAVIRIEGDFNYSALNNAAVRTAHGEFLCFLNNDIEIIEPDWLQWLVSQAARPDIGAAGARLLYPDGTLQHAGVFIGIGGGAAHAHRFLKADERGYFDRSRLPQRVSAVTGACLVVSREKFSAVGGFDETNFRVAFNDIDLCLKLNQRGWQSFYEPRATLVHHESKSRGSDKAKGNRVRFADELSALKRIWHTDEQRDPFHHPQLSPFCEQFVIAV
jgi:GT2 family glycosyltransferase